MADDGKMLDRIILNPKIMLGKPVIRGTRLTVDFILNFLAHDTTEDEITDTEIAGSALRLIMV